MCVRGSESWAWGWREEGTCSERMVICVEEVMESGHHWPRPPTWTFTTTKHAYFIPWQSHCYKEYDKRRDKSSVTSLGTLLILNKDKSVCTMCCYWGNTSYNNSVDPNNATSCSCWSVIGKKTHSFRWNWWNGDKVGFLWSEWAMHLGSADNCPSLWDAWPTRLLMSNPMVSRHHPHTVPILCWDAFLYLKLLFPFLHLKAFS